MKKIGIYGILNIETDQLYIGSSINCNKRFSEHKTKLRHNKHSNARLQNSWNQYGENQFVFRILESLFDSQNLIKCEQHWIDNWKPFFNIRRVAESNKNCVVSEETRRKISIIQKGKKTSEETKLRMSLAQKGKKRKPHSEETRLKMSLARKGRKHSQQTIQKIALSQKKRRELESM